MLNQLIITKIKFLINKITKSEFCLNWYTQYDRPLAQLLSAHAIGAGGLGFKSRIVQTSTVLLRRSFGAVLPTVAYAGFFNGGGSVTSYRDDVKILRNTTSSRCDVTGSVNLDFQHL